MDPVICPSCHKPHEDAPDLAGGRVKVCKACHPAPLAPKPSKRSRKGRPKDPPVTETVPDKE
jgi:hypothetical protein